MCFRRRKHLTSKNIWNLLNSPLPWNKHGGFLCFLCICLNLFPSTYFLLASGNWNKINSNLHLVPFRYESVRFAFKCRFKGVLVDWFVFMTATNIWHIPRILLSGSKGCASSSFFEDWLVSLAVHFPVRRKKIFFPFTDPVEWHIRRRLEICSLGIKDYLWLC